MAFSVQRIGGGLGDFRSDMIDVLSIGVGKSKATKIVNDMFATIRAEAEKGARAGVRAEIPYIKEQVRVEATGAVRQKVSPLVIGSLAVGGIAVAVSFTALIAAKRK